jgi:type II secretory pathway pseudopilin PulG
VALVEALVAITVLAVLAAAFGQTLYAALGASQRAKVVRVAEEVASAAIEQARHLAYDQLGIVGGNPPGTLPGTELVASVGGTLTVSRSVGYVNDPLPGGFQTGANYKRVTVRVRTDDGTQLVHLETVVAPPTQPSLNKSVVRVRIVDDALNEPVAGAVVQLLGGPSSPRADISDAAGEVIFAALDPNPVSGVLDHYELAVTAAGYTVLEADLPPAPAARMQLSPGQLFATAIRVFKPVQLDVNVLDPLGLPFAGTAQVSVSSARGGESVSVTGGHAVVTGLAGEPLVPALDYTVGAQAAPDLFAASFTGLVPDDYPTVLTSTVTLTLASWPTAQLRVQVRDDGTSAPLAGYEVVASGGPANTSAVGITDATGIVQLDVPLGDAPYIVRARPQADHGAGEVTVVVDEAGTTNTTLELTPA